jgi:hypothetical protein
MRAPPSPRSAASVTCASTASRAGSSTPDVTIEEMQDLLAETDMPFGSCPRCSRRSSAPIGLPARLSGETLDMPPRHGRQPAPSLR